MIPDGAGPDALAVAVHAVPIQFGADLRQVGDGVALDRPIYQIARMQNDHARRKLERGGDRVIVRADADAVNVAVVGGKHWIPVSAVALVAPGLPGAPRDRACGELARGRRLRHQGGSRQQGEQGGQHAVAQTSKSAVPPTSKSAGQALVERAGLETRDTADLEDCATLNDVKPSEYLSCLHG